MSRTHLQIAADRHAADLRRSIRDDLRRMREDAGVSQAAVARLAGVSRSVVTRIEAGTLQPTLETCSRLAAALGADLSARVYPQTGPPIRDRHQARIADLVLAVRHPRWRVAPEVAVRRPVRGWIDLLLHDPSAGVVVAAELESMLRRIEQLLRWSTEKASALPSSRWWAESIAGPAPPVSRLLVVRWTRSNREAAAAARRLLREAYPADARDALESLTGPAPWPGAAMVWARLDGEKPRIDDGWMWR